MYTEHLKKLISCESITPKSNGAIEYIHEVLLTQGFEAEIIKFGFAEDEVTNLYAVYGNKEHNNCKAINICFAGHVDVVSAGDIKLWRSDPFTATIEGDRIYGRGAVDMKGAIACFLSAISRFLKLNSRPNGAISFLITSDEEGSAVNGTKKMLEYVYKKYNPRIDLTIIGEATSQYQVGDTIKIGRRGSINFCLTVYGTQGHVAYPEKANNPLKCIVELLHKLVNLKLDNGSEFFGPSNLEITSIDVANNTTNVIPNAVSTKFNVRFNNLHSSGSIITTFEEIVAAYSDKFNTTYKLDFLASSDSFIQNTTDLINGFAKIVHGVTNIKPIFSATGGTSDARFIKDYSSFLEFGLTSDTAHKVDECVKISDLQRLHDVYYKFLMQYLN